MTPCSQSSDLSLCLSSFLRICLISGQVGTAQIPRLQQRFNLSSLCDSTENMFEAAYSVASCRRTRERSGHLAFLQANWVHTCALSEPSAWHSMENQMAPQLIVFLLLGLPLLSLSGIHTYMNTDLPVMWAKVEAEMDD